MNIQAEKLEIMRIILETENPLILSTVRKILEKKVSPDFWEALSPYEKQDILDGISDLANEDTVDYEKFIKKHR